MSLINKEEIKHIIEAEIQKTASYISEYEELTKPIAPENAIGRISRMDAINNKSVTEAALRKAREKLDKLKFALTKIDDSDFGICIKCKREIPVGRLIIMPQSRTCVNCTV